MLNGLELSATIDEQEGVFLALAGGSLNRAEFVAWGGAGWRRSNWAKGVQIEIVKIVGPGTDTDELGLYYFRARWYGVNQLGFLERDPVIGGSHAQNIYMFLRLNPFGFSDSSGEKEFKDWGSWLGTFVEHPSTSLEKLFSSGVISMWEYSNSGLEIKPNGNMWYQLRADFESPSALTLIRFGDENVPT